MTPNEEWQPGRLRSAYDTALAASTRTEQSDAALVEVGRTIADQVDATVTYGEFAEIIKVLGLLPHLVNILRELLATPASRLAAEPKRATASDGKLAQLRALNGDKQTTKQRRA